MVPDNTMYLRVSHDATYRNAAALIEMIEAPSTIRVLLFASPRSKTDDFTRYDAPDTNLPLLSALVEHEIPAVAHVKIILDQCFLTAARPPREAEVSDVLDAAEKSSRTFFARARAPFTGGLEPENAATKLLAVGSLEPLTTQTRPEFFAMLSELPETRQRQQVAADIK